MGFSRGIVDSPIVDSRRPGKVVRFVSNDAGRRLFTANKTCACVSIRC